MPQSITTIPLAEFLSQPNIEASPAWELIDGRAVQKTMPTLFHSRLQRNLVNYINDRTDQFEAVQELRCGDRHPLCTKETPLPLCAS